MNVDGSDQHRVYFKEGLILSPSWSPDGSEMIFANDSNGVGEFRSFRDRNRRA
jgi:Tol biopolymer transport system component